MSAWFLNLKDPQAVREAFATIRDAVTAKGGAEHFKGVTVQPMISWSGYELILGSSPDPQFGPVLLFGIGGQLVEVIQDRSLALPPLEHHSRQPHDRAYAHLRGVERCPWPQGRSTSPRSRRFSCASPCSSRSSRASPRSTSTRCSRRPNESSPSTRSVVLHPAAIADADLPRLAIRPYPRAYVR